MRVSIEACVRFERGRSARGVGRNGLVDGRKLEFEILGRKGPEHHRGIVQERREAWLDRCHDDVPNFVPCCT